DGEGGWGEGLLRSALAGRLGGGRFAAAPAERGVVDEPAAVAAGAEHRSEAVAVRLDHRAAFGVAAGAGEAAALRGHLPLAGAHREVVRADRDTVVRTAAGAHAAGEDAAEVLHGTAGELVLADAVDLHPVLAALDLEGAARHHLVADARRHHARR